MPISPPISSRVLTQARAELISAGVVRDPRVAGDVDGLPPPAWIEPRGGSPDPGDKTGDEDSTEAVVSIFRSGGFPPTFVEQRYHRQDTLDFVIATRTATKRDEIAEAMENVFLGSGDNDEIKMNWQMGSLTVIQSRLWRALQPLGSDEDGFRAVISFFFETYTS